MERELFLKFLESNTQLMGTRYYKINFNSLDNESLSEMVELFRYILSQLDLVDPKISNISNRCCHLCIERRFDSWENNKDTCFICNLPADEEKQCNYSNDYDARHLCPFYRAEK